MTTFTLPAVKREGAAAAALRAAGKIPAILYGVQAESLPLAVEYRVFYKLYHQAGDANLVDLTVDGDGPTKVLIQAVQLDPVKGRIIHADLRQIDMNRPIETTMHINLVGESAAVKELGGTLVAGAQIIHIKCLPKDLVSHVEADIAALKTFTNAIHISDLKLPPGITVLDNLQTLVAKVKPPLTEAELKAMEEGPAKTMADVEVEKKGKKEEEEAGAEPGTEAKGEKKEEKSAKGGSASGGKAEKKK